MIRASIRFRVLAALVVVFTILTVGIGFTFSVLIERQFQRLENQFAAENVERLRSVIRSAQRQLAIQTDEWAKWDDTYEFMSSKDPEYREANLTYESLSALGISFIVYYDSQGAIFDGYQLDDANSEVHPLNNDAKRIFESAKFFQSVDQDEAFKAGFVEVGGEIFLAAATTITDSSLAAAPRGMLLRATRAFPDLVDRFSSETQLPLKAEILKPKESLSLRRSASRTVQIQVLNENEIRAELVLPDVFDKPTFRFMFDSERAIYRQGLLARNSVVTFVVICALVSLLVLYILLRTWVVGRLFKLVSQVRGIAESATANTMLVVPGTDEIAQLGAEINLMLQELARAERDLRVARDAAESANQAKSAFVAKVSHELRTPIHSITGMLRILFREERSPAKRDYIKMARDAAYSLLGTINDILDFSKMESGSLTVEKIPFSLREMLRDSIRTVGPRADEKKDLELVAYVDPALPDRLLGDPLRLKQSMINLLGNAVKFTPQGAVTLEAKLDSIKSGVAHVRFLVRDTGVGIPAHRLDKIFDPFTQADDSVARVFTGTGLGLTITKQLSEAMGGSVSVTSALGLGTEFVISVPLPIDPAQEDWALPPLPVESTRVVIVDEQSAASEEWTRYLKAVGYTVDWVHCGDDRAVERAKELAGRAALIIVTEVALSRSAIFNMIVARATHPSQIPLVAVLSSSAIALREKLLTLSIGAILVRPALPEDLILVATGNLEMETSQWAADIVLESESEVQLRILLADDTYTNRFILQSMLEEGGHHVTAVTNGQELLDAIALTLHDPATNPPFDAVFTDVQMPVMDGMTATRKIRELETELGSKVHTPIFAVTAHAMNEEKSRMRESGVDDVVTKPVEPAEVSRVLGMACEGKDFSSRAPVKTTKVIIDEELTLPELAERVWDEHLRAGSDPAAYTPSPSSPGAGNPKRLAEVVNIADTFERSGRSTRRTLMIFKAFLGSYRDVLADLSTAKSDQDADNLRKASHSLKGILLEVGAVQAGGVAAKIENLSSQGELQEATKLINGILHQTVATAGLIERIVQAAEKTSPQAAPASPLGSGASSGG